MFAAVDVEDVIVVDCISDSTIAEMLQLSRFVVAAPVFEEYCQPLSSSEEASADLSNY